MISPSCDKARSHESWAIPLDPVSELQSPKRWDGNPQLFPCGRPMRSARLERLTFVVTLFRPKRTWT